jgi:hypothetical protein
MSVKIFIIVPVLLICCKSGIIKKEANIVPERMRFSEYLDTKNKVNDQDWCSKSSFAAMTKLVRYHYRAARCYCENKGLQGKAQNNKVKLFLSEKNIIDLGSECLKSLKTAFTIVQYITDTSVAKKVDSLKFWDQYYRLKLPAFERPEMRDSFKYYMNLQQKVDSTNLITLRQMVEKNGWPGWFQIGSVRSGPNVIIVHNSEKDNILFLKLLISEAEKQNIYWEDAKNILGNLLFRFRKNGYFDLREVYIENQRLDRDKSLFALHTLGSLINDNPYIYNIQVNKSLTIVDPAPLFKEMENLLKALGADINKVVFHMEKLDRDSEWPLSVFITKKK